MIFKWLLLLFAIGTLLHSVFGEGALLQQRALSERNRQLRHANDSLVVEIQRLKGEIKQLKSDSLILEALARTRLGLSKEGEVIFRFVDGKENHSPGTK